MQTGCIYQNTNAMSRMHFYTSPCLCRHALLQTTVMTDVIPTICFPLSGDEHQRVIVFCLYMVVRFLQVRVSGDCPELRHHAEGVHQTRTSG